MATKSGLAEYLTSRFDAWRGDRKSKLDDKWQANLNAIKRVDDVRKKPFKKDETKDWRSDAYIGITKAKVFTVFSILVDILLVGGRLPFALKPSPYERQLMEDEGRDEQNEGIERMEARIREQQADRKADREAMKKLLSLLIYGMCISKYNVQPVKRSGFQQMDMGMDESIAPYMETQDVRFDEYSREDHVPGHVYTSIWNMYWDMEGGGFQDSAGYCERQLRSAYDLKQKKGKPFYIDEVIDRVISEHRKGESISDSGSLEPGQRQIADRKKSIRTLEFWCRAPRRLVDDYLGDIKNGHFKEDGFNYSDTAEAEESGDDIEILAEMAGDEIIRLAVNESGERPHRECYWEVMLDESSGEGIPDNLDSIQHFFNGLVRAFLDNKKLSANVILALKERHLKDPSQVDDGIKPGLRLDVADTCDDARKALSQIIIQDVGATLNDALGLAWQWKDTVSLIPEILQGSTIQKHSADTAYELSQLLQFGSKYVGLGIRNYDEMIIEPEVMDLYRYNMRDPDMTDGKGAYICNATGFTSFQDKLVKIEKLKQMLVMVLESEILSMHAKVRPHLDQIYSNMDLDPDEFLKTEEEINQEIQQRQEAEAQAIQAEQNAKQMEIDGKLEEQRLEGEQKSREQEAEFQRDIIKEGFKSLQGEGSEQKKKTQGGKQ